MPFSLTAKKREAGKAEDTRNEGLIPGVLYGPEIEPISIALDYNTFEKLYNEVGESTLIDFTVEGQKESAKVLIQAIQIDPIKRTITHVDLRQIQMGVEMTANVDLNFIGESSAVKEQGGTLVKTHDWVEVKCLPRDLVSHIDVDLSALATFEDVIHVKDLQLPAGVVVLNDPDTVLAKVNAPLTEEQLKAMEEEGPKSVEDVKVEEKGKEKVGEGEGKKAE